MNTLEELNAGSAAKALDDIGELIDQLAANAREFDFNTANRMERDAAKALLIIEGAINALPGLIESARRVERLEAQNDALRELLSSAHVLLYAGQRLQTELSDWAIDAERQMEAARAALQTKGT
jgi:hypothetical protein